MNEAAEVEKAPSGAAEPASAQRPGKKPKTEKESPEPLTEEDLASIERDLDGEVDDEEKQKVRNVLSRDGLRTILRTRQEHIESVEAALLIADRWDPRNENKTKRVMDTERGPRTVAFPAGNLNSIDELETDSVYLSALNAKISNLWAISKTAVNRAKANLSILKVEAKKRIGEARRAGHLRGKLSSVDQVESLANAMRAVREAEKDLLDVDEQAELLSGCYYATKDLSATLMERARGRRKEQWEAKHRQA